MNTPVAITIHFDGSTQPAVITSKHRQGWYAVGTHFGTYLHEDQHIGSDQYDPTFSVRWETTDTTNEHRQIAAIVGEVLR